MGSPITLVFTDMVGSSAAKRAASLGPDSSSRDRAYLSGIQTKHLHVVRDALPIFGGKEIMTIGDSFFLTFEDPQKALQCCAAIQQKLRSDPIATPSGPLRLRIGIHIGTPEYFENSWHGTDVDTAARAESVGSAEQIILTDAARKSVGNVEGIKLRRLGTFALKGVGNVPLWDADYSRHGIRHASVRTNEQTRIARIEASTVLLVLATIGSWFWRTRPKAQPPHDNVSVLVADFKNQTSDPVFDNALEQPIATALEGAPFINTFNRNQARKTAKTLGAQGTTLDENMARLIAQREGIAYVVSGDIERHGNRYRLTAHATSAASGRQFGASTLDVNSKEAVLQSVPVLAARLRTALGDTTPKAAQLSAAETYTTGSLEAARFYAEGQDLQWSGNWDEAAAAYRKALALDPQMGRAYSGLAVVAFNSGNKSATTEYFEKAMANMGRMSERERYRTRGIFYLEQRDVPKAIDEFTLLVKKYPADSAGRANLALAYFYSRDMPRAFEEGIQAVALSPNNVPQRNNVGLYAMYAGLFDRAIQEQERVLLLNPKFRLAYVGKAISQLALGADAQAKSTWDTLAQIDATGASAAADGLADLALYEGRIEDALQILRKGAAEDLSKKNKDEAAVKFATVAYAEAYRHNRSAAIASADKALSLSSQDNIRILAAEDYVAAHDFPKAHRIGANLAEKLENDDRAYAHLIEGMVLLESGKAVPAIGEIQAAQKISDTWLGHFYLGRAYIAAKAFAQADSEFDTCQRRRGEAAAIFLDEEPTYHLMPLVDYYQGIARRGLNSLSATQSFEAFLRARPRPQGDPLVTDALRRNGVR